MIRANGVLVCAMITLKILGCIDSKSKTMSKVIIKAWFKLFNAHFYVHLNTIFFLTSNFSYVKTFILATGFKLKRM